jgi:hypothetical protein
MLTAAGVTAPDGNELAAFQTGIWGAFVRQLQRRQPHGLDHAWVSFFTYEPRIGAEIFSDWVQHLPNLHWIKGQIPLAVDQHDHQIKAVRFEDFTVEARITIDATELGDLLVLAEVPYRWGWEWQAEWDEPSAPVGPMAMTERYPVQAPTWVVVLQDFGEDTAPAIPAPPIDRPGQFVGAWDGYGIEPFLNYGRLPGNRFMMNWPQRGNDYGVGLNRLVESQAARYEWMQEAYWHSQSFARFLQTQLGQRYGLAETSFPKQSQIGGGAYALHPYYRESRRLRGIVTVLEQDILPQSGGRVAALPVDQAGGVTAIALGNYANDHHYPGIDFPLKPKSIRWGGRWTGTPFTLPYGCLIPNETDGLLVGDKNSSVSHIANGATRLQPVVLGLGQAAGMAAALCVERGCQPRELPVAVLQSALLEDPEAPMAIVPLFNLPPDHPDWLYWQHHYINHPETYPIDGNCPLSSTHAKPPTSIVQSSQWFTGLFQRQGDQAYALTILLPERSIEQTVTLVTLDADVDWQLQRYQTEHALKVLGRLNQAGNWLLAEQVESVG